MNATGKWKGRWQGLLGISGCLLGLSSCHGAAAPATALQSPPEATFPSSPPVNSTPSRGSLGSPLSSGIPSTGSGTAQSGSGTTPVSSPASGGGGDPSPVPSVTPSAATGSLALNASVEDSADGDFTKYVYSFPLPDGAAGAVGLSGDVTVQATPESALSKLLYGGSDFSEALFSVGYVQSGSCLGNGAQFTDYATLFNAMPGARQLGSFIVKAWGTDTETVSTDIQFPATLPIGGCIYIILDGMPPTRGSLVMTSLMSLDYSSQSGSAYQIGPGDEFCVGSSTGCQLSTLASTATFASVTRVPVSGTVLSLYGDVSEGAMKALSGAWSVTHDFYLNPGCSEFAPGPAGFGVFGPGSYFSVVPPDSTELLSTTLAGSGDELQSLVLQPERSYVNAGDCLVHLVTVNGTGSVDAESQMHALILPGSGLEGPAPDPGYGSAPMYRFYDPTTQEHFFTASQSEGASAAGFTSEGTGFLFLTGTGMAGTSAIYRCFDGSKHFISLSPGCEGATTQSVYGSLYSSPVSGSNPVYRLFNRVNGDHLETLNLTEGLENGYRLEMILGYAPSS